MGYPVWQDNLTSSRSVPLWRSDFKLIIQNTSYNSNSRAKHYNDVIMSAMASQITDPDCLLKRLFMRWSKKTPAPLAFVGGIHRRPVDSPHKGPVMRKMFPFDSVIMTRSHRCQYCAEYCHERSKFLLIADGFLNTAWDLRGIFCVWILSSLNQVTRNLRKQSLIEMATILHVFCK